MESIIKTKDLTIAFGGHVAVNEVSVDIPKNQFTSVIGPNGAGKTTFFNMLSGQLTPTKGQVFFKGEDITKKSATERARIGIGRSFQITNVFPNITVFENVRLAIQSRENVRFQMLRHFTKYKAFADEAMSILETVLLKDRAKALAVNLSHGEKRKLEIAMLLALNTEVLLLDEPTAGMSLEEVPAILDVIKQIKEEENRTIILIEHKMDMVLGLSDQVMVLFNGEFLAQGSPDEIMENETVQAVYIGGSQDDKHTSEIGTD
ncbi:ABC transporter ATP-binding protein [Tenuibacillus multivorans]|uniref:Branched-chain amino acid transport system ATP-binding protein n=1 Tax=Tenuibacillus multivorans TaxID=237069 RepID=A0A1H0G2K2_9BACI|nr:ABC transporter ATP-binding protein [Tenuibacillus multivorans]GEL78108.1 ABC transporter ATP-binding protein [Tenuibacillus multivorans]SDO01061.1 branched-chain amino acid transport system ATP-binding protein [Tenuibacillus multivorans]